MEKQPFDRCIYCISYWKKVDFPASHVIVFWKLLFLEVSLPFLTKKYEEKNEWMNEYAELISLFPTEFKKNTSAKAPAITGFLKSGLQKKHKPSS